jgi:hypothetical protein
MLVFCLIVLKCAGAAAAATLLAYREHLLADDNLNSRANLLVSFVGGLSGLCDGDCRFTLQVVCMHAHIYECR